MNLRQNWFSEFERCCRDEFAEAFGGAPQSWLIDVDEAEWKVVAWQRGERQNVAAELPYNFLLFRPASIAENVVTRLWEQARRQPRSMLRVAS